MLYHLLFSLREDFSALNVFQYITFRTGGAIMTALFLSFFFGPAMIRMLRAKQSAGPADPHRRAPEPYRVEKGNAHYGRLSHPDRLDRRDAVVG